MQRASEANASESYDVLELNLNCTISLSSSEKLIVGTAPIPYQSVRCENAINIIQFCEAQKVQVN